MNNALVQEKLAYFHHRSQYVVFDNRGVVQDSCQTLFEISPEDTLYDSIPFMEAMQEAFAQLPLTESLAFLCIKTNLMGREGYYNFYVKRESKNQLKWFIYDLTEFYTYLQPWQQERNDQAIAGEYLRLQQRAAALEKELLEYRNDELHRIEQMKTAFFSQVSHEMRTPLNSIVGLAHLLNQQATPTTQKSVQALETTARHLATIINDVLDWAKLENDTIEIDVEPFLIEPLVQQTVEAFHPVCEEKDIILTANVDSAVPNCLVGDATRLAQILYNLVGNAVKFTHRGEIKVSVEMNSSKAKKNVEQPVQLRFLVQDTGIGMTPEEQQRIANPYVQANDNIHQRYGGTGLGLSIVHKLVKRLGGTWSIDSQPQQGTTVAVNLSFPVGEMLVGAPTVPDLADQAPTIRHIQSVLVAEDDAINQKVVSQLLIQWGLQPTVVEDGKQALEKLRSKEFDLLILDYQMPKMDGSDVLKVMQQEQISLPVIVLSGNADKKAIPSFTKSPVHTLSKPVLPHILREKIVVVDCQIAPKPIDLKYLRQITDNQLELMVDLMETFIQQAPQAIENIKKLWQSSDPALLNRAVHKAKPGFQYVGATNIEQLLDQLENYIEKQEQWDAYEPVIKQIEKLTQQAVDQIQQERNNLLQQVVK